MLGQLSALIYHVALFAFGQEPVIPRPSQEVDSLLQLLLGLLDVTGKSARRGTRSARRGLGARWRGRGYGRVGIAHVFSWRPIRAAISVVLRLALIETVVRVLVTTKFVMTRRNNRLASTSSRISGLTEAWSSAVGAVKLAMRSCIRTVMTRLG